MRFAGHLRTVGELVRRQLLAPPAPPSREWNGPVRDPLAGDVRLSGRLSGRLPGECGGPLVLAVHGLGGSADSRYLWELAAAAGRRDWAILRLNLRGADRRGGDFHHGGLTADLHAALASPALAGYGPIAAVGFSLGGHTVLRLACEGADSRLRAVAAVCPPLDLAAGQQAIDRPGAWIYRRYVLRHLKQIYRAVAARPAVPLPLPVTAAERIATLWDWDEAVVAPRYGFAGAADYYARASVAPRLAALRVPALVVATQGDPMVPAATLRPWLELAPDAMTVRWVERGGHVAFPRRLSLGYGPERGLAGQLLAWCGAAIG
ncbi:MAG: alpha/beta fold hydrolase [Acidobacteriota bacterium]|nr:alpha/beta fold hydrolase [Acidobacteriota bacterium]MDH3524361.1 alpha/beta fold hydrolase [Acidobacteriota bacterium]